MRLQDVATAGHPHPQVTGALVDATADPGRYTWGLVLSENVEARGSWEVLRLENSARYQAQLLTAIAHASCDAAGHLLVHSFGSKNPLDQ